MKPNLSNSLNRGLRGYLTPLLLLLLVLSSISFGAEARPVVKRRPSQVQLTRRTDAGSVLGDEGLPGHIPRSRPLAPLRQVKSAPDWLQDLPSSSGASTSPGESSYETAHDSSLHSDTASGSSIDDADHFTIDEWRNRYGHYPRESNLQRYLHDQSQTLAASTRKNLAQWADVSQHALGSYRQTSPTASSMTDRWAGIRAKVARIKTRLMGWRQKVVGGAKKMRARWEVWRQKAGEATGRVRAKISAWRGRTGAGSAPRRAEGMVEAARPSGGTSSALETVVEHAHFRR